jgi:hypothetical protein
MLKVQPDGISWKRGIDSPRLFSEVIDADEKFEIGIDRSKI